MTRDIDSPDYRDSNVGEGMIPSRKSATPKPRAGEHTSERALEELAVIETCDRALLIHGLPAYSATRERERELVEALEKIASCHSAFDGDVVSIAYKALAKVRP